MGQPIRVDTSGIPEQPTFVLATHSANKLGQVIGISGIKYHKCFNGADEIYFDMSKYIGTQLNPMWNAVKDFRLIWYREIDEWFIISTELDEGDVSTKHVTGTAVCEAELGQINLHNIEINTESDILRDDYTEPTVFYHETNTKASLIDRLLYKCPNYSIGHIDESLKGIQRQFTFDETSVYDAFMDVADEVGCLFVFGNGTDDGAVARTVNAYDLQSYCNSCHTRFEEHATVCPNCGSADIVEPYGINSGIVVSRENLTKEVRLISNVDSTKNCFYLTAGDDVMSAAVRYLTPDGSGYIWHFTDAMKDDMSDSLRDKINDYDKLYEAYQTGVPVTGVGTILFPYTVSSDTYNTLVTKYDPDYDDFSRIYSGGATATDDADIVLDSYSELAEADYTAIDFYYYLNDSMMPGYTPSTSTITEQAAALRSGLSSGLALLNISTATSHDTIETTIRSMSRHYVDRSKYDVSVTTTSWTPSSDSGTWVGYVILTDGSDSDITASTGSFTIAFTSNAETYINQQLKNKLNMNISDSYDIEGLFGLNLNAFINQLKEYSLSCLKSFYECCNGCLDILIKNGCGNPSGCSIAGVVYTTLYTDLYTPWYNKLQALASAIDERSGEVAVAQDMIDQIEERINKTHDVLDFESYIGEELWLEFIPYRREDTYNNSNFCVYDSMSNSEIIDLARQFVAYATKELYKSAELQHSISSTLYNLLIIPEFAGLRDNFDVGVWIRVIIDDVPYNLRLLEYTVDWENYGNIEVTFSDIDNWASGYSDLSSVLNSAKSMSTSYGATIRQAERGNTAASMLAEDLNLTLTKLVSNADNQEMSFDENGLYMREWDDIIETYSPEQLKITSQDIAFTDDNWRTVKTALGKIIVTDHDTNTTREAYGLLAENVIGTLGSFVTLDVENITLTGSLSSSNATTGFYLEWDLDEGVYKMGQTVNGVENHAIYYDQDTGLQLNASYMTLGVLEGPALSTISTWAANTKYIAGKYVVYNGTKYQCVTTHTSESTFDATYWSEVSSAYRNYWNLSTGEFSVASGNGNTGIYLNNGNLAINASSLLTGTIANASGDNYWNLDTGAFHIGPSVSDWLANTAYYIGDYVKYNNVTYCCNTAHTSGSVWSTYASYFTSANGKAAGISYNSANGMNLYYNSSNYWDMKTGYFNFGGMISYEFNGNTTVKYIDPGYLNGTVGSGNTYYTFNYGSVGGYNFGGALQSTTNGAVIDADYIKTGKLYADSVDLVGDLTVWNSNASSIGGSMGYGTLAYSSTAVNGMHISDSSGTFECGLTNNAAWLVKTDGSTGVIMSSAYLSLQGQTIYVGTSNSACRVLPRGDWDFVDANVSHLNVTAKFG